jgi:hypothetical protein
MPSGKDFRAEDGGCVITTASIAQFRQFLFQKTTKSHAPVIPAPAGTQVDNHAPIDSASVSLTSSITT